jgi:3-phosphoshikimate 1-carboxyvinyltransferase
MGAKSHGSCASATPAGPVAGQVVRGSRRLVRERLDGWDGSPCRGRRWPHWGSGTGRTLGPVHNYRIINHLAMNMAEPTLTVPGDKSLTHRALYLAGIAPGLSRIEGGLTSLDIRSTARVLRRLGIRVGPLREGAVLQVHGGPWHEPNRVLHCGNSGTTARLGLGLLAGHAFRARLTGDRSLRRRPMRRVTEPLERMGARINPSGRDRLPLTIQGGALRPLRWELPVSSAQLKGALLLAGVVAGVEVRLREPAGRSRDHTERMLRSFGYPVDEDAAGWVHFRPTGAVRPFDTRIPGDISSAAFLIGAITLAGRMPCRIRAVGVNPTRAGFLAVLGRMGGRVEREGEQVWVGEPVADLLVSPASLRATRVAPEEVPGLIDEIPMLAVLAARAEGTTVFEEVGELRVKESDRLGLLGRNLAALGLEAQVEGNALYVTGTERPPRGRVITEGDHRIAMAFAVLGLVPGAAVAVDDLDCAAVSFPGFRRRLEVLRQWT